MRNAVIVVVVLLIAACGGTGANQGVVSPKPVTTLQIGSIGRPGCTPGAPINAGNAEAGFDNPNGSLWMLVFGSVPPVAGQESKIVWRMTGNGDLSIWAEDSSGVKLNPKWGPEGHGSSSWNHPGTEVGTGFLFSHPGCWHIRLVRIDASGDAWLTVV